MVRSLNDAILTHNMTLVLPSAVTVVIQLAELGV